VLEKAEKKEPWLAVGQGSLSLYLVVIIHR
jgi:hypothetical protein